MLTQCKINKGKIANCKYAKASSTVKVMRFCLYYNFQRSKTHNFYYLCYLLFSSGLALTSFTRIVRFNKK